MNYPETGMVPVSDRDGNLTYVNQVPDFPPLRYFKDLPDAPDPMWATETSACFDLRACLITGNTVKVFSNSNAPRKAELIQDEYTEWQNAVVIGPMERALIPTGLIFDIPVGFSVRLHSRSGLALKQALVLGNQEGVIDSDYVDPTFVILMNLSDEPAVVKHGDRVCQAEMIVDSTYRLLPTSTKPGKKTDRNGGLGSTGI